MKAGILYLFHLFYVLRGIRSYEIPKIAIVGSGIGGSSCAHFLRELKGEKVEIDVYEAANIGGRVSTREYKGATYEVGGCIIHSKNKYMNGFREKFQLQKSKDRTGSSIGIYDQNGIEFMSSEWKLITYAKMLLRYGYSLFKLDAFIEKMLEEFDRIYELQEQGRAYLNVEDMLGTASPNFLTYFTMTSEEGFSNVAKINNITINELIKGSLRVNYGQSTNVHLFVGSVSVAGMTGSLWSVEGGNKQIPELLIKNSNVKFINNRVTRIEFHNDSMSYTVDSVSQKGGTEFSDIYDFVVLAHPITKDCKNPIEFVNFEHPIKVDGSYHRTVSTIISGTLNASYFGIKEKKTPDLIIINDITKVINSVGKISPVKTSEKNLNDVWKVFSQRPLTDAELDELFVKRSPCTVVDWLAYPEYDKLGVSSSFMLHSKMYYINAIEWAASAMEMSVIAAKNVALLVAREIHDVDSEENLIRKKRIEL